MTVHEPILSSLRNNTSDASWGVVQVTTIYTTSLILHLAYDFRTLSF